jgi:HSP20 family protein
MSANQTKPQSEDARQKLLKDFQTLSEELESLMRNFFGDKRRAAPYVGHGFMPPLDFFETESELVCLLDLVGVAPQDLTIKVVGATLFINGIRRELPGFQRRHYHKMELEFGVFERTLSLPEPVDADSLRVENLGGFYLVRLRKLHVGLRPTAGAIDSADLDPRR